MIRNATEDDIPSLIEIQTKAMPDDLLPRMGTSVLTSIFWPAVLSDKSTQTIVYVDVPTDHLVAFGIFTRDPPKLAANLTRNKLRLVSYLLPQLIKTPSLIADVAHSLGSPKIEVDRETFPALETIPELYLFATRPGHQGKGYGSAILKCGIASLVKMRMTGCVVKTSAPRARELYLRAGWIDVGFEYRHHRRLWVLHKSIAPIQPQL